MTGLVSDHGASIEFIIEEHTRLQKLEPKHTLLKYISNVTADGFDYSKDSLEEFTKLFAYDQAPTAVTLVRYYIALREAIDKIEGIDRSPKPKSPRPEDELVPAPKGFEIYFVDGKMRRELYDRLIIKLETRQ